jgi:endonuclease-8
VPEGDTVFRAAQFLDRALSGRVLTRTDFRVPQHATADLSGSTVVQTLAHGKHLLTRTDNGFTLHTHLKMEGAWHVYRLGEKWRRPSGEVRVLLEAGDVTAVGFSLGVVELIDTCDEERILGHLGPDLLGPDWDQDEALRRLRADPDRSITAALLDQRNLAGIGNMYAAELCFTSGIHPGRPISDVTDLPRLVRRAKQMLEVNKERAIQSTTGDLRSRMRTWVYRRDKSPCRRCGTTIQVAMRGEPGRERAPYWCPSCQPAG